MKKDKINSVLKHQISLISPSKQELSEIEKETREVVKELNKSIKKHKIKADIFIGGSYAKGTLIKKDKYDIDIFIRFDKNYEDNTISALLAKIVPKSSVKVHGSRDYFKIKIKNKEKNKKINIEFEIIPTIKIKDPSQAKNITDLSYFHVNYVKKALKKNKRLKEEIMLAKAFTHFQDCYGAESYINGFSGYALELLIIYYKSFENFLKASRNAHIEKKKLIIDQAKLYKNKLEILREINEAKLHSPIILIDPTFRERNALAALSQETLDRFQKSTRDFLKNPSNKFFEKEDEEQKLIKRYKNKLIKIEITTKKQAGDIAGTKLKKFYGFFIRELERYFNIQDRAFIYNEKTNQGKILLVAEQKKQIIFSGPPIEMKEQMKRFKLEHKKIVIKNKKAQATEKNPFSDLSDFLGNFQAKSEKTITDMGVDEISLIKN
jgi:tRNA nucleotidyltransferase (CCA-adding enzyme)